MRFQSRGNPSIIANLMSLLSSSVKSRWTLPFDRLLAKNTVVSIAGQVSAVLCSALLGIFLARFLGAASYGDFTYAYTLLLIAVIPAKLGLDTTAMKVVASYDQARDLARMHGFLRYSVGQTLVVGCAISVGALGILLPLRDDIPISLFGTLIGASLCIPALSVLHVLQYIFYGLRRYGLGILPESIIRPLLLIFTTYAAIRFLGPLSAAWPMVLNFFLTTTLVLAAYAHVRRTVPAGTLSTSPEFERARWRQTGYSMLMISGLNLFLSQTDIVLLGYFAGTYEAGLYAAAARIALLCIFFYSAINSVAAPVIARAFTAGDSKELHRVASLGARYIVALTLLLSSLAICFGRQLLWLFGEPFVQAYPVLVILAVAQLFKSISGLGGFLLTMTAHEGISARLSLLAAISNIILAIAAIPKFGAVGAALSTLVATVVWSGAVILIVRKRVGINCWF